MTDIFIRLQKDLFSDRLKHITMSLFVAILASIAAFLGGMIALRFKDKLHIILGLSAGAVIGAALFDLIPESIELGSSIYDPSQILTYTAIGFMVYLVLDRLFSFHNHNHLDEHHEVSDPHAHGSLGAASFCLHSLIDGIAIGLAFQASVAVGAVVAVAVVAHRFSDGINTVGVILRHRGHDRQAKSWLVAVALAPIAGTLITYTITVGDTVLATILAVFAGFFLYIGASDLIPEGHHSHSKALTTVMTIVGAAVLYLMVHL